jgi:hypothetical protein
MLTGLDARHASDAEICGEGLTTKVFGESSTR